MGQSTLDYFRKEHYIKFDEFLAFGFLGINDKFFNY